MFRELSRHVAFAAAVASPIAAGPASAQGTAPPLCSAFEFSPPASEVKEVGISCAGSAALLGRFDSYDFVRLPSLRAGVVVVTLDGSRRVWLAMKEDGQTLAVEEITGTIERLTGRGVGAGLDGVNIDFGPQSAGRLTASINASGNGPTALDLAELVGRSRAMRGVK